MTYLKTDFVFFLCSLLVSFSILQKWQGEPKEDLRNFISSLAILLVIVAFFMMKNFAISDIECLPQLPLIISNLPSVKGTDFSFLPS